MHAVTFFIGHVAVINHCDLIWQSTRDSLVIAAHACSVTAFLVVVVSLICTYTRHT